MSNTLELYSRISTVAGCLSRGMTTGEIKETYMPRWGVSERTIDRYIELGKDKVMHSIRKTDALIETMRAQAVSQSVEQLLSNLEIQALLCSWAKGEQTRERKVQTSKGEIMTLPDVPTFSQSIQAVNSLLKMRGETRGWLSDDEQLSPGSPAEDGGQPEKPLQLKGETPEEQELLDNT